MTSPKRPKLDPVMLRWVAREARAECVWWTQAIRDAGPGVSQDTLSHWRATAYRYEKLAKRLHNLATLEKKRLQRCSNDAQGTEKHE